MPFISSVSGALGGLLFRLPPLALPPIIVMSSTTNFNQDRATFNATVTPNGATTSVKFQYSTNATTWTDGATVTGLTGIAQSVYSNQTGLSPGTLYYVRAIATNSSGSTTSSLSTTFTTWSLQVYERTTSGGTTLTIPTITPTGGSAVEVSIYDIIMFGGGGGGYGSGGGGGGYQSEASRSLTGNRTITTYVGGAGVNGKYDGSVAAGDGGNTTINGDLTTLTANGGAAVNINTILGASSGNGFAGGALAQYDYVYDSKFNIVNTAYGGGGGAGGPGQNGAAGPLGTTGGNGGSGVSITRGGVTISGGAGGGGATSQIFPLGDDGGPHAFGSRGTDNNYGSGGNGTIIDGTISAQPGFIRFRYYAGSAVV